MAEGSELVAAGREAHESSETAAGDVLEEDALHGVLGAELEDLLEPGLDRTFHCPNSRTG